jgi:FkbM family methyltransferase
MLTSPPALAIRNLLRALGLTRLYARIRDLPWDLKTRRLLEGYRRDPKPTVVATIGAVCVELKVSDEQEFARAMTYRKDAHLIGPLLASIGPGDILWDIGANFGLYGLLAARVPGTHVFLFDPDPWCVRRIRENVQINRLTNVETIDVALSDHSGVMPFQPADHSVGGTSHLLGDTGTFGDGGAVIKVPVVAGDQLRVEREMGVPNAIKIDVEGFEWEVLQGLRRAISDPACRYILIEVHFGLLAQRGLHSVPGDIERFLSAAGFGTIVWPDASHVCAQRAAAVLLGEAPDSR